jgi:hypothetical protein
MSWKPLPSRWTLHSAKKKKPIESRLSQIQSLRLRFHGDAAAERSEQGDRGGVDGGKEGNDHGGVPSSVRCASRDRK